MTGVYESCSSLCLLHSTLIYQKMLVFLSCDDKYCKLDLTYPRIPVTCCARQIFQGFFLHDLSANTKNSVNHYVYITSDFVEVIENAMNSFISNILVDIIGAIWVLFLLEDQNQWICLGIENHAIPIFVDLYFIHYWGHMYVWCFCLYFHPVTIYMYPSMQIHHHLVFKVIF